MANLFQGLLELVGTLIREKEILEPCALFEETSGDIDINNNQNYSSTMKATWNWAQFLIVLTGTLTNVMSCIKVVDNKAVFDLPKLVHKVVPEFVTGVCNCIEFTEPNA